MTGLDRKSHDASEQQKPLGVTDKFFAVMKKEGADWKQVCVTAEFEDKDIGGLRITFPGNLDLSKYELDLSDLPKSVVIEGSLTIDQKHVFHIIDSLNWSIHGDMEVTGKWSHAMPPSEKSLDKELTERIVHSGLSTIGGQVKVLLSDL